MAHNVNSVQALHDDAFALYNNAVIGANDYSSDVILGYLVAGKDKLASCWKGKDAGVQIENIVKVHNAMIGIRETVVLLASLTSQIAANYREIQNSNGAGLESFGIITAESKTAMADYTDVADSVNITAEANEGKAKIDAACEALDKFKTHVSTYYNSIMQNWTVGTQREEMVTRFDALFSSLSTYKTTLSSVSQSITTAIANYGV